MRWPKIVGRVFALKMVYAPDLVLTRCCARMGMTARKAFVNFIRLGSLVRYQTIVSLGFVGMTGSARDSAVMLLLVPRTWFAPVMAYVKRREWGTLYALKAAIAPATHVMTSLVA